MGQDHKTLPNEPSISDSKSVRMADPASAANAAAALIRDVWALDFGTNAGADAWGARNYGIYIPGSRCIPLDTPGRA